MATEDSELMPNIREKLVAYFRVSTAEQGRSGLGLEAQEAAVERHAAITGGEIIARYTEVESGTADSRPEVAKAKGHALRSGAKLLIAKLDRLGRDVHFISGLIKERTPFVCCDNTDCSDFGNNIRAAMAQEEARLISQRTKAALAAAKARGVKLGSQRPGFWTKTRRAAWLAGLPKARERSAAVRRAKARTKLADLLPAIRAKREGGMTLHAIADALNAQGQPTPKGKMWVAASVQRALQL